MKKSNIYLTVLVALVGGIGAMEAQAANSYAYTLGGSTPNSSTNNKILVNPGVLPIPQLQSATGYYADNGGTVVKHGSGSSATYTVTPGGFASGAKWTQATSTSSSNTANSQIQYYGTTSGWGMASDGDTNPNHAFDNGPMTGATSTTSNADRLGNTEALMLSFSSSVVLNTVDFGWVSGDADFSVFRYVGTSPPPNLNTLTASGFATLGSVVSGQSGWELVGNYGDVSTSNSDPAAKDVNAAGVASSWWLVSAYNTSYATSAVGKTIGTSDQGDDYFKIYGVTATAAGCTVNCTPGNNVPEPGSLALVSLGLLGLAAQYRRRAKSLSLRAV